ncbi:MAG TPA: zf-HC2 domain-containing protein, partial [Chloroflexota bacterium]
MTSKWPLVGLFSEHERVRRDLSAYLDDQLDPDDRARVERHLAGCTDCQAELESLRRTVGMLRMVPPVAPPRSFLLPTSAAPAARPGHYSPLYFQLRTATAALAAMLVAVVAVNVVFNPPTALAPTEGRDLAVATASSARPTEPEALRSGGQPERPAASADKPAAAVPAPAAAATRPAAAPAAQAAPAKAVEAAKPVAAAPVLSPQAADAGAPKPAEPPAAAAPAAAAPAAA